MLGVHFWVRLLTLGRSQSAGNKVHKSFHIAHARAALEPENAAVGRQSLPGGQSGWRLLSSFHGVKQLRSICYPKTK